MSLLIYFIVLSFIGLFPFLSLVLCLTLDSSNSILTILSKYVYLSLYSIRIASLQGNHGYFLYIVVNKNKIRQSWKILQLSFTLLHTIIHSIIFLTLHNSIQKVQCHSLVLTCSHIWYTDFLSTFCGCRLLIGESDCPLPPSSQVGMQVFVRHN